MLNENLQNGSLNNTKMIKNQMSRIKELELLTKSIIKNNITYGLSRSIRNLQKEIRLYKNHINGTKNFFKKDSLTIDKLQIGGGTHILKDFVNIDILPPADLICDVREGIPLPDNCVKLIFNEHILEHLDYPQSVKKLIKEFFRVIKPSGDLIIGVPDSEKIIKNYVNEDKKLSRQIIENWYNKRDNMKEHINTKIDLINYALRDQDDDPVYTSHLWSFDYEKLKSLLTEAGFSKIKRWPFDKTIANPKRRFCSLYVTAKKI